MNVLDIKFCVNYSEKFQKKQKNGNALMWAVNLFLNSHCVHPIDLATFSVVQTTKSNVSNLLTNISFKIF